MHHIERIHLLSRANNLSPLRGMIKKIYAESDINNKDIDDVIIAINEACMNIIQHAYKGFEEGEIIVDFFKNKNEIMIRIHDFADKSDFDSIKSRDLEDVRPGGIGVHFMSTIMDKIEYQEGIDGIGNTIELTKKLILR